MIQVAPAPRAISPCSPRRRPEADVLDADAILVRAMRSFVALGVHDGEIDDAVSEEHAFGKRTVEPGDFLQADRLLVELGSLPRILNAERDVADAAFSLCWHGLASLVFGG
jgi:hypothetical protein